MAVKRGIDETHGLGLKSWLPAANSPGIDFPIQNLPFGIFRRKGAGEAPRVGVAIGDRVLDVSACRAAGLLDGMADGAAATCAEPHLNRLASLGPEPATALRQALSRLLREGDTRIAGLDHWETRLLPHVSTCEMLLPVAAGDYTDFYASIHHATNVGRLFRPDQPLLPNYKHVPIGYHGRASSLVVGGTPVRRPWGQSKADDAADPVFAPSKVLDYEVEAGLVIGRGNALGTPIPIAEAEAHLFGICLLNDWSARDIQKWEYQPLGPFLAKSFATSLSPWVVTWEALAPYRVAVASRPTGDPAPLAYLDEGPGHQGAIDMILELTLLTPAMREQGLAPARLSRSHARDLYWTPGQLVAHHTGNGCNLQAGDILGTGTISGPEDGNRGCLLEITRGGKDPIALANGETRRFLQDGDEVILAGYCEAPGFARIGLGECRGTILPALPAPRAGGT